MLWHVWVEVGFAKEGRGIALFFESLTALMQDGWSAFPDPTRVDWALGSAVGIYDEDGVRVTWHWSHDFDWADFVSKHTHKANASMRLFQDENVIAVSWDATKPDIVEIDWEQYPAIWTGRTQVPDLSRPSARVESLVVRHSAEVQGCRWVHVYA
ncbi:MAG TPA: hypothetical protein VK157_02370 [Phycisphaerales bacterium]|nr:hypothetical protein [Phycisphaerales bacterium]